MAGGSSEAVKCPSGSKTSLPPRPKKVHRRSSQCLSAVRLRRLRLQSPGGGWADCGGGGRERRPLRRTKKKKTPTTTKKMTPALMTTSLS